MDTGQVSQAQAQPSLDWLRERWERSYDLEPQISETSEEESQELGNDSVSDVSAHIGNTQPYCCHLSSFPQVRDLQLRSLS